MAPDLTAALPHPLREALAFASFGDAIKCAADIATFAQRARVFVEERRPLGLRYHVRHPRDAAPVGCDVVYTVTRAVLPGRSAEVFYAR